MPILLQDCLAHLISFVLVWPKALPKHLRQVRELRLALPKVHPLVPIPLAQVGDISHLTKGSKIWSLTLELEEGLSCQVVDVRLPFSSITPKDKWQIRFTHVLAYALFNKPNVELRLVCMLGAFLQYSKGGSDLVTERSHLFQLLSSMQITDEGIWDTNLLAKQSLSLWNLASACHLIHFNKAFV